MNLHPARSSPQGRLRPGKAGTFAEFFKVEGAPHAFWNGEWVDDTVKRALEFFRKQLGTTAATGTAARK